MRSLLLFPLALLLSCQPDTVSKQDTTDTKATDADDDGHAPIEEGGDDCDDNDATVHPGATETPYDGLDQDCDGQDLVDVDGDSHAAMEAGGDDCDDTDASIHPGAKETWYDGIDQDCDSNDCDSDFDGHSSTLCGGDDCNDAEPTIYPGATEVPYDSFDQDCDGLDLVDVDGDGYVAMAAGGDDCDDTEASAHPGGIEARGDEVDNDCDGRFDEYVVCADASGDFTTIQEGVDGTPDGGTIEICPGVYAERVDIVDRGLNIEGAGEMPEDTIIDANDETHGMYVSGATTELDLEWMGFASEDYKIVFYSTDPNFLRLGHVFFGDTAGCGSAILAFIGEHDSVPTETELISCYFNSCEDGRIYLDIGGSPGETFELHGSIFTGGSTYFNFVPDIQALIHNNIFNSQDLFFRFYHSDEMDIGAGAFIYNNTLVDIGETALSFYLLYPCSWGEVSLSVHFTNNVLSTIAHWVPGFTPDLLAFWQVYRVDYSCWDFPEDAVDFHNNLLWDIPDGLYSRVDAVDTYSGSGSTYEVDTSYSEIMLADSVVADPLFEFTEERGSYTPSLKSPCNDAGDGDPDPDGSPNDIGAFGGPDGDWWMEFPWPIP